MFEEAIGSSAYRFMGYGTNDVSLPGVKGRHDK